MMWLEMIHIRMTDQECERLTEILTNLVSEIHENEGCQEVRLYRRSSLKNDICLHLSHNSDITGPDGSPVGLHLAETLKPFGMVNHTVWTEVKQMVSQKQNPGNLNEA